MSGRTVRTWRGLSPRRRPQVERRLDLRLICPVAVAWLATAFGGLLVDLPVVWVGSAFALALAVGLMIPRRRGAADTSSPALAASRRREKRRVPIGPVRLRPAIDRSRQPVMSATANNGALEGLARAKSRPCPFPRRTNALRSG